MDYEIPIPTEAQLESVKKADEERKILCEQVLADFKKAQEYRKRLKEKKK